MLCAIEDDAAAEGMMAEARAFLAVLGETGSAHHGAAPASLRLPAAGAAWRDKHLAIHSAVRSFCSGASLSHVP